MAAHSSILAWRSPWTEEPGGYSPQVTKSRTQRKRQHAQNISLAKLAPIPFSIYSTAFCHRQDQKRVERDFSCVAPEQKVEEALWSSGVPGDLT